MDGLVLIGIILLVLWLLSPIFLFIGQSGLKRRLAELEARIAGLQGAPQTVEPPTEAKPSSPPVATRSEPLAEEPTLAAEPAEDPKPPQPKQPEPPKGPNHAQLFFVWLKENWVLATGALSLAFAGLFLVQYGAERGLLTPSARVIAALGFGGLLLVAGEFLRRRFGDEDATATRFLPSALSGAGFVTLFAAILAARALYGLIGPGPTFAGLVLVSFLAVLFGWFYGPVLSAIGILGAIFAPYLVGGDTDSPWLLSWYFAAIAIAALAIDAFKRWAWLSILGPLGAAASIWFIYLMSGDTLHFLAPTLLLAAAAVVIPERQIRPSHEGPPILTYPFGTKGQSFPTWIAFAGFANAAVAACFAGLDGNVAETYLALLTLIVMIAGAALWLAKVPALSDLILLPSAAFLGLIILHPSVYGAFFYHFKTPPAPETGAPLVVWHLVAFALGASLLGFWRLRRTDTARDALLWSLYASISTPLTIFLLEFLWSPAAQYGDFGWALGVIAIAAAMVLLAERTARLRHLPEPKLAIALFAAAAIALIGLALFLLLTKAALTLALAVMVLLVVLLDRHFDLPLLGTLISIGMLVISYRAVVDPGLHWAVRNSVSIAEVALAYLGTGAILFAALHFVRPDRPRQKISIDGGIWVLAAALGTILLERWLPADGITSHWGLGMLAGLWSLIALLQFRQLAGASWFERIVRYGISGILAGSCLLTTFFLLTEANPLFSAREKVLGVAFFSTLALAYLPLAVVLWYAATILPKKAHMFLRGASGALIALYVALSIRHFWRGPNLAQPGVSDPELYSYTLAMLLAAAGGFALAFWRRSLWLRRAAMIAVGLTVAKVFLIDMAGLTGLMRVFSFLGLGLSLLGLTWLNRLIESQWEKSEGIQASENKE